MSNFKDKISKIIIEGDSKGGEKSKLRKNNPWLKYYSSQIARRILAIIEGDKELSQKKLATVLNVSPQQVSKIIKGQENLTLETIYKISAALEFDLITFPPYKYNQVEFTAPAFEQYSNVYQMYKDYEFNRPGSVTTKADENKNDFVPISKERVAG